ncbi:hypothetical protein AAFF_G00055900 [Aldrovandia affinis]|uniref:Uncharacterized protein n=1 Tax=Aldrovandia affinis TaxID=143900 RepID=A0AAD7S351_9TELE|nr:hypothetical protein AAFF_G00055900 [Aldrovandia affinis]
MLPSTALPFSTKPSSNEQLPWKPLTIPSTVHNRMSIFHQRPEQLCKGRKTASVHTVIHSHTETIWTEVKTKASSPWLHGSRSRLAPLQRAGAIWPARGGSGGPPAANRPTAAGAVASAMGTWRGDLEWPLCCVSRAAIFHLK